MELLMANPLGDYIECQLEVFRREGNFSSEELQFFNLRAKKLTMIEISQEMHISRTKCYNIQNSVLAKMKQVEKMYVI